MWGKGKFSIREDLKVCSEGKQSNELSEGAQTVVSRKVKRLNEGGGIRSHPKLSVQKNTIPESLDLQIGSEKA